MLIRHLASENPPTELVLRLQHAWKLGKPSQPDQFFAFGTLWTDAEGIRIQGDSHRNFAAVLMKRISIGSYYKISGFTIRLPRPDYRTCQFPHWLSITPGTRFELQPLPDPAFTSELFELVSFSQFPSRMPPCPYLTDFVGKLIKIGSPNHVEQNSTVAPVQNVTVADESGREVDVSLWSELSTIIDPQTVILDDLVHPAVVLFSGFKIGKFRDRVTAYSGSASRVIQEPYHPAADALRVAFADSQCSIVYVEPKFPTPEKLKNHVKDSYRTVQELLAIYVAGGESEPRYRCTAKITGFDRQQFWCYTACPHCSCTVVANGHDFWCKNHDTVLASDVAYRYRLKLFVADQTNSTVFVLLGLAADRLLPITATELARAYPSDYGEMPPPLQLLVGQHVTFEVHLPRHLRGNTCDDFVVTKIWGIQASRAHLLSQLPVPVPPMRSPSPPSRHNTPIPPDPRYVPPVMINLAASTKTPQTPADTFCHLSQKNVGITPLPAVKLPSQPSLSLSASACHSPSVISHSDGTPVTTRVLPSVAAPHTPMLNTPVSVLHSISPSVHQNDVPDPEDDVPLATFLHPKRLLTPAQQASAFLSKSPLGKVKKECLPGKPPVDSTPTVDGRNKTARKRLFTE